MSDNVVQMRDFKRREENAATVERFNQALMDIDTAPSEMPPVQPNYQAPEQDPA